MSRASILVITAWYILCAQGLNAEKLSTKKPELASTGRNTGTMAVSTRNASATTLYPSSDTTCTTAFNTGSKFGWRTDGECSSRAVRRKASASKRSACCLSAKHFSTSPISLGRYRSKPPCNAATSARNKTNTALLDLTEVPVSCTLQAENMLCTILAFSSSGNEEDLPGAACSAVGTIKSPEVERWRTRPPVGGGRETAATEPPLEQYDACTIEVKQPNTSRRTFSSRSLKRRTSCMPQADQVFVKRSGRACTTA
mmetsp:Transcript_104869/g.205705  ORF Transcript_104869/g.205705 Transcript_104869/m.205705 type:complete len:256 (-) Transcript_104869:1178-1945(-)